MSLCAIIPVGSLAAANASLEAAGFGPRNFSFPAYGATGATHTAHSKMCGIKQPAILDPRAAARDCLNRGAIFWICEG